MADLVAFLGIVIRYSHDWSGNRFLTDLVLSTFILGVVMCR